jgi:hypothetical protein
MDHPRVFLVRHADSSGKARLFSRDGNKMNVIIHQAISPDLDPGLGGVC